MGFGDQLQCVNSVLPNGNLVFDINLLLLQGYLFIPRWLLSRLQAKSVLLNDTK